MFKIIRNNRRFGNKTFPTYADARRHVRTWAVSNKLARHTGLVKLGDLNFKITKI